MNPDLRTLLTREPGDDEVTEILALLRRGPMVEDTLAYCRTLAHETVANLPVLPASETADILRELPLAYLNWATALIA
jgi:heptaprenyl diphosphate synthase/octaprenyl-diphosphate synthase